MKNQTYKATITYKKAKETFDVADCGHGKEWATVRAVAYFFSKHPDLLGKLADTASYKARTAKALKAGLKAKLVRN